MSKKSTIASHVSVNARIRHIVDFLDQTIVFGKFKDNFLSKIAWVEHDLKVGLLQIKCYSRKIQMTIGELKSLFGTRYTGEIVVDTNTFVQLCYAIENIHLTPHIFIDLPIQLMRLFSPKIKIHSCKNQQFIKLLGPLNTVSYLQWTYNGLSVTKNGIEYHTPEEWNLIVQANFKEWALAFDKPSMSITIENIKNKAVIDYIKKTCPTLDVPMGLL